MNGGALLTSVDVTLRSLLAFGLVFAGTACGQEFKREAISVGAVGAFPVGIAYAFSNRAGVTANYGFKLSRYFQLDAGLEYVPRLIGDSDCCEYVKNAEDSLYLVPFGGRLTFAPQGSRWEFGIGGGGAYARNHVGMARSFIGLDDQAGWGGYAVGSADYALTRSGSLSAGVVLRTYFIGGTFQRIRFINIGGDLSYHW